METYTLRSIAAMLGLSRRVVDRLIAAGFVTPSRGPRREYRFTFQDVVLLRTAHGLQTAAIPPRKILRSLQRLKATLPNELPLSGLRISAVGNEVAVRSGETQWQVESGQLLFDFEVRSVEGNVSLLSKAASDVELREPAHAVGADAAGDEDIDWFRRGVDLEAEDRGAAEAAYRKAIAAAPQLADAYLNLGAALCEAGRCVEAVALYSRALEHCEGEPLVHYNLGVALEDLERHAEALVAYEAAIALDPALADAHYNAARLAQQLGEPKKAIRHFNAYRRLQR